MSRLFMCGTRYEFFERLMMSPDRRGRDEDDEPKVHTTAEPLARGERLEVTK